MTRPRREVKGDGIVNGDKQLPLPFPSEPLPKPPRPRKLYQPAPVYRPRLTPLWLGAVFWALILAMLLL